MAFFSQELFKKLIPPFVLSLSFVGMFTMLELEKWTFHTLFVVAIVLSILYIILQWWRNRRGTSLPEVGRKIEFVSLSILVFILFLAGAVETYELKPWAWGLFLLGLMLVAVNTFLYFKKTDIQLALVRKDLKSLIGWVVVAIVGFVLIILMFAHKEHPTYEYLFDLWSTLFILLVSFIFIPWFFRQIRTIIRLKSEQSKIELLHLQSQVNPHFFFNTLNNLYGLIDKDQEQARALVLKLSDMMRYSIYEGQKDTVPLEEEVLYIEQYIDLHKARYHKDISVKLNVHIQVKGARILPLLLIILLENAFKHGVENLREEAYVNINLIAGDRHLIFGIENNFDPQQPKEKQGIGLNNLRRRLELAYPKRHTFNCHSEGTVFKAQLTLDLQ